MFRAQSSRLLPLLALLLIGLLLAACVAPAAPAAPAAEAPAAEAPAATSGFPDKALQVMAPANPGGGWDTTARLLAQALQESGVSPVPVEVYNVGGAGGTVGLAQLASQNAGDPYNLMVMGRVMVGSILTNASPVTLANTTPLARLTAEYEIIVVPASSPYQTMQELVAAFQADPRSVSWAGGSAGGTDHILVGQIAKEVGVGAEGINYIAYSGGGEAVASLLGGQVVAGVSGIGEFIDFVTTGELRALAVSSAERLPALPDVPTLIESGVNVELLNWRGIVAPPDIGEAEKAWLLDALVKVNESEEWTTTLATNGWDNVFLAGLEFESFLTEEDALITQVLKDIGLVQ